MECKWYQSCCKKGFLDYLADEEPDILCIQESKAHKEQLTSEILEDHGYYTFWHSGVKKGYSGVATFSKKEPLFVQEGLGIQKYDDEGRVLITEHDNFLLYNIYFPNGQKDDIRLQYKLDFYDDLLPIINEQVESGNNVIVTGDWNTAHHPIDLARPKENINTSGFMPIEREKLDNYVSHGWVDTFRLFHDEPSRYSWWTYRFGARQRNVGWRIDYFFVSQNMVDLCNDADIHDDIFGSDHCPVSLDLDCQYFLNYLILITICSYGFGMFNTIMEIDAMQYASMSREILRNGNFLHLFDNGQPYLDKPPLIFWITALFFKLLGPSDFVYRLPSLFFTIILAYSTYKFSRLFYTKTVSQIAAILLISSQAIFVMNADVRTDIYLSLIHISEPTRQP